MKFGPIPVGEAEGTIAAHSVRHASGVIRKGTVLTADHVARLQADGVDEIVVARLRPDDVHEDEAARRVAALVGGANVRLDTPGTGRCNLFAETSGLLVVDRAAVDALNRLDPGITLATLPEFEPVEAGRMVATVKIIPFGVPAAALAGAEHLARAAALSVAPWQGLRVGVVNTILPGLKPSVVEKTQRVLAERLRRGGAEIVAAEDVPHDAGELARALRSAAEATDLVICFGASAVVDRFDVIPAALEDAGGRVVHLGMPVDPGNLLLLGDLAGKPVLGAPGCARSPAENGFDWVLNRLLAGLEVTPQSITGMGVGGLLMEIVSRPQPREPVAAGKAVAAVVLAAGQSRRMGGPNKLLATFDGVPLVRRSVLAALQSRAAPVIVVTGHMDAEIRAALDGLDVQFAHNPDYAEGLATSLKAGIAALPDSAGGAVVVLADMPGVTEHVIDALVGAHDRADGPSIVVPTMSGKRGNPVLWSRGFFPELAEVTGDTGARHLIGLHADAVRTVEIGSAVGEDVDTPEALVAAGGRLPGA